MAAEARSSVTARPIRRAELSEGTSLQGGLVAGLRGSDASGRVAVALAGILITRPLHPAARPVLASYGMSGQPTDPVRPTDDEARALARSLIEGARSGALGVIDPDSGAPMVTRIAVVPGPDGAPAHADLLAVEPHAALDANPGLFAPLGEPGPKGDPLTHPRLTIQADGGGAGQGRAQGPLPRPLSQGAALLRFRGFPAVRLGPVAAFLNGGFGKAYRLTAEDLARP
jgi:hypothetical protein